MKRELLQDRGILPALIVVLLFTMTNGITWADDRIPFGTQTTTDKQYNLLKQKVYLLDNLLNKSGRIEQMEAGGDAEVLQLIGQAIEKSELARKNLDTGNLIIGNSNADEALLLLTSAARINTRDNNSTQILRARYQELLNSIETLTSQQSMDESAEIHELVDSARDLAMADDYRSANKVLVEALDKAATSSEGSYDKKTLIYSLNFENPLDELRYEQERYENNRVLLTAMLDSNSSGNSRRTLSSLLQESDTINSEASQAADNGKISEAIVMLEKVNEKISRVLGMLESM